MQTSQRVCHSCANILPEDAIFCAQCGAPQLVLTETDAQRVADERVTAPMSGAPLPRVSAAGRIRWRPVVHIVAVIALVAGVAAGTASVLPPLSFVATLLVLMGPLIAINFYQRRVPGGPMGAGVGARIGAVLGLMLAAVVVAVDTGGTLVDRYALHHGAQLDQEMNAAFQQKIAQFTASYSANAGANASGDVAVHTQQMLQYYLGFVQSPDGHAAMALAGAGMLAVFILGYCVLSGVVLGWLKKKREQGLGARG
jgi:membrane-associated phospholipid phosphatase